MIPLERRESPVRAFDSELNLMILLAQEVFSPLRPEINLPALSSYNLHLFTLNSNSSFYFLAFS